MAGPIGNRDALMEQAKKLLAGGCSNRDLQEQLGISEPTARRWRQSLAPAGLKPGHSDVLAMENAALRQQIERQKSAPPKLEVTGYEEETPFPTKEMWERYVASNSKKIERALAQQQFKVRTDSDQPVGITFVSDQHISGDNCVDLKRMQEDAEFIAATPRIYAVLGGDGIDNHIKHRAAILAARTQPDDQLRLFDFYLQIFAEKVAVMISGNHDAWSNQMMGVDVIRWMAEKNKVKYSPHSAYIEWQVGKVVYRVCVAHQYRFNSAMNQTHSPKQMLNFGEYDFDIGVVCHNHEPAQESFRRRGLDRWVARPGSYQVYSDYSAQYGYPTTTPTCPTVVVYPDRRKLVGFSDVRDAARFMGVA